MWEMRNAIIDQLQRNGITAVVKSDDQLIVARQAGPVWPDAGNSFWLSTQNNECYICTWSPTCYRIPRGADVAALCIEFMSVGDAAQAIIPSNVVLKYGLEELSESAAAELFSWPCEDEADDDEGE